MAEEKKEEAAKPPEAVQAPAAAPNPEVNPVRESRRLKSAAFSNGVKAERPANCASCNKSIKTKRWYYRNGKYYCSKRCWQAASKKEKPA